jgi:hypothetical protein
MPFNTDSVLAGSIWLTVAVLIVALASPASATITDLAVAKRVVSADDTVQFGERIEHHTGLHYSGSENRDFSIVEIIRSPMRVDGTVVMNVLQGQISTRRVTVENRRTDDGSTEAVVRWRGTMSGGETRIRLDIPVRAEVACRPGLAEVTRQTRAGIAVFDGSGQRVTASRDYQVQCPPMVSPDDIEVSLTLAFPDEGDSDLRNGDRVADSHDRYANQVALLATLTNHGGLPATVGVLMGVRAVTADPPGSEARFAPVLLQPDETRTVRVWTDMRPRLRSGETSRQGSGAGDHSVAELVAEVHYVLLSTLRSREQAVRPDPAAEIRSVSQNIRLRGWDFGDAPDSSNRAGVPMSAYPNVRAGFPTVFDVPPSAVAGPAHARPRLLHLGQAVSLEADADLGQEANIQPARNRADLDDFDDGTRPSSWNLQHCRATRIEVQVYVSREAAAWFATENQNAYLNAWLDFDRDGQWGRVMSCPNGRAYEHFVIDHPVDVAALGPGYHRLQVPTGRIHWPAELSTEPAWARLTLSETPSVKTGTVGSVTFGDGRGPDHPWQFGETEDYLLKPPGAVGAGPDLEVRLTGSVRAVVASDNERSSRSEFERTWVMKYANVGSERAENVVRSFTFPELATTFQEFLEAGVHFFLVQSRRDAQTIYYRMSEDEYSIEGNRVLFETIDLEPGEQGRVVMWYVPDMDSDSSGMAITGEEAPDWTVRAEAVTASDINPDSSVASFSDISGLGLERWPEESRISGRSPTSPFWVPRGTTNSRELSLRGFLPTGETATFIDARGNFYQDAIANEGYVNIWLQIIAASSEGNDVGALLHLQSASSGKDQTLRAGRPEYLAPGVYVEEVSFQSNGRWELELTNLPDAHYRIAVGNPHACDDVATGLVGDEWELIGDEWGRFGGKGKRGSALAACALFTVDSTLPIDPISLGFLEKSDPLADLDIGFDNHGRPYVLGPVILPDTLGFERGDWSVRLPPSMDEARYVAVFSLNPALANADPRLVDRYGDQQRQIAAVETAIPGLFKTENFLFDEADALFGRGGSDHDQRGDEGTPERRELLLQLSLDDMELAFGGQPEVTGRGRLTLAAADDNTRGETVRVELDLLVGVPLRGDLVFVPFNGLPYGQPSKQVWELPDEGTTDFLFSVPRGVYQIQARADGYQTFRSQPFFTNGPIEHDIVLQPMSNRSPQRVIMIEDQGLSPAYTDIAPGGVVRLVNLSSRALVLGVDEFVQEQTDSFQVVPRQTSESVWPQGGLLLPGDTVEMQVGEDGLLSISDLSDPDMKVELLIMEPGDQIFRDRFGW